MILIRLMFAYKCKLTKDFLKKCELRHVFYYSKLNARSYAYRGSHLAPNLLECSINMTQHCLPQLKEKKYNRAMHSRPFDMLI